MHARGVGGKVRRDGAVEMKDTRLIVDFRVDTDDDGGLSLIVKATHHGNPDAHYGDAIYLDVCELERYRSARLNVVWMDELGECYEFTPEQVVLQDAFGMLCQRMFNRAVSEGWV